MRPLRIQKWLWQPTCRQTLGAIKAVPSQSGPVAGHQRQLDDVPAPTGAVEHLHWTLDVTLGEDRARNRKDNEPENLTILRKLTLNVSRLRTPRHPRPAKTQTLRVVQQVRTIHHRPNAIAPRKRFRTLGNRRKDPMIATRAFIRTKDRT